MGKRGLTVVACITGGRFQAKEGNCEARRKRGAPDRRDRGTRSYPAAKPQ